MKQTAQNAMLYSLQKPSSHYDHLSHYLSLKLREGQKQEELDRIEERIRKKLWDEQKQTAFFSFFA